METDKEASCYKFHQYQETPQGGFEHTTHNNTNQNSTNFSLGSKPIPKPYGVL